MAGSFTVISGKAEFSQINGKVESKNREIYYNGTIVIFDLYYGVDNFSISDALSFGYTGNCNMTDYVEMKYLSEDLTCLDFIIKEETTGCGNRIVGKQLRTKVINLIDSEKKPIIIDWSGIPIISSSFADEFMGKMFLHFGPINFSNLVKNINMEPIIKGLLDKGISQRLTQAIDVL